MAGVSHTTVSHVINGTKPVRPEVEVRVREAIQHLGYRPHRQAQALRRGWSRTIGLILPDLTNPFFPGLAQAVAQAARRRGYTLALADALGQEEAEREALALLGEERVAGAIWIPTGSFTPVPFPVVLLDRTVEGVDGVEADHRMGGRLQAQRALALGHRRVGLLSGPRGLRSACLRREGFLEVASGQLEVVWEEEVPFSLELTPRARARLQRAREEVSLVVAANDTVALAALGVLREEGVRVPEEVSLIGYDDIPWAALAHPALTTVRQPLQGLAEAALDLLLGRLEGAAAGPKRVVLPVELVVRDSDRGVGG